MGASEKTAATYHPGTEPPAEERSATVADEFTPPPQAWRLTGFYPEQYAKSSSALDMGIDYDEDRYAKYEAEFLADLAAHDREVAAAERERCARIAETAGGSFAAVGITQYAEAVRDTRSSIAAAIREGGS